MKSFRFNRTGSRKSPLVGIGIKVLLLTFVGTMGIIMDDRRKLDNLVMNLRRPEEYIRKYKGKDKEPQQNSGDQNSLNLLLLSNPKVHQYVKDWFSISNNSISDIKLEGKRPVPLEFILGTAYGESGTYNGTNIPRSWLSVNIPGLVKGKAEYSGSYKDTKVTLMDFAPQYAYAREGPTESVNDASDQDTASDGRGRDRGVFQQDVGFFERENYLYPQSKALPSYKRYNWLGGNESRKSSVYYFPDEVINLHYMVNNHAENNKKDFDIKTIQDDGLIVASELIHGVGSMVFARPKSLSLKDCNIALEEIGKSFRNPDNIKSAINLTKKGIDVTSVGNTANTFALMISLKNGFYVTGGAMVDGVYSGRAFYDFKNAAEIYRNVFNKEPSSNSLQDMIKEFVKYPANEDLKLLEDKTNLDAWGAKNSGSIWKNMNGKYIVFLPVITMRKLNSHFISAPLGYGKLMRQLGMAEVDPTKPETYLTGLSNSNKGKLEDKQEYIPRQVDFNSLGNKSDYIKSKKTGASLMKEEDKLLAWYFASDKKNANNASIRGDMSYSSEIVSIGEKDGFPILNQGQYMSQVGNVDTGGMDIDAYGCAFFALTSAIHGIGWGDMKAVDVPQQIKTMDINKNGYLDMWELTNYVGKVLHGYNSNSCMTIPYCTIMASIGLPSEDKTWESTPKDKAMIQAKDDLLKGYPMLGFFTGKPLNMYKLIDKDKKEVESVGEHAITRNGHYVMWYSYGEYKDIKTGKIVKGVSIINSTNKDGFDSNNYIVDLESMYDAKRPQPDITTIKRSMGGGISEDKGNNKEEQTSESPNWELDDRSRIGEGYVNIYELLRTDETSRDKMKGIIGTGGVTEDENYGIFFTAFDVKSTGKTLTFKQFENSGIYFELTADTSTIFKTNLKNKIEGRFSDVLENKNVHFFSFRKYKMDGDKKKYLSIVQDIEEATDPTSEGGDETNKKEN